MDNCVAGTKRLLKYFNVRFSQNYLEDAILGHPDHPSLLSITDTLEKYQIESLAIQINAEKLLEMPLPCIVQMNENGNKVFAVLNTVLDTKTVFPVRKTIYDIQVSYFNYEDKLITSSMEDFIEKWTGVCLLIETSDISKEPGIERILSRKKVTTWLKAIVLTSLFAGGVLYFLNSESAINIPDILYTTSKFIGLGFSILLLWFEIDKYNPTLQAFCSGGKKVNCNAVLDSKQAQILGGNMSLSSVVFAYFLTSLLCLFVTGFNRYSLSFLAYLSFMTAPVIVVSFYYQAFKIKQWCKFCIGVLLVLCLEIIIAYSVGFYKAGFSGQYILFFTTIFAAILLIWESFKSLFKKEQESYYYKRELKKLKNNPGVLQGLLSKSRKIKTPTDGLGISFTNTKAKYDVIKVCNPYCGPCAHAHPILDDLAQKGLINLQILFNARVEDEHSTKPVRHFLAIENLGDVERTQSAMDTWYHSQPKDYDAFAKTYPLNGELGLEDEKIKRMRQWCEAEKITHTPTVFVNGYELPREYAIADLTDVLKYN